MTEDRVDFEWMLINNKKCAHFTFQNQFTTEIAKNTLQNWDKEFQSNLANGEKIVILCSCLEMTRYDSSARLLWQKQMNRYKDNILSTWIISNNIMIKTAAKTMGLLGGFDVNTANSIEEADI